jgi:hypothetical protein
MTCSPRYAALPAALLAILLAGSCEKPCAPNSPCPTPTPGGGGSCASVGGSRNAFWSDSCGRSGSGTMVIAQSGCTFTATFTGLGTFSGTVSGSTLNYTLTFADPCSGTATGTATVSGATVSGTFSGTESGTGCCNSTSVTGNLTFQFPPTPATTSTPTTTPTS